MSLRTLEKTIVEEARKVLCNPKMRLKDLMEWRTSTIEPTEGETVLYLEINKLWISVPMSVDKRPKEFPESKEARK